MKGFTTNQLLNKLQNQEHTCTKRFSSEPDMLSTTVTQLFSVISEALFEEHKPTCSEKEAQLQLVFRIYSALCVLMLHTSNQ